MANNIIIYWIRVPGIRLQTKLAGVTVFAAQSVVAETEAKRFFFDWVSRSLIGRLKIRLNLFLMMDIFVPPSGASVCQYFKTGSSVRSRVQ
jgi:hypothetical protein